MKKTTFAALSTIAWLPSQAVMAQDLSSEISPATVWFALLVVMFALLVAVGLFLARDDAEDDVAVMKERSKKPARPAYTTRVPMRRTGSNHHKQKEFS